MPRYKRQKSITKVYHVIIRGINKQDIFFEKEDFLKLKKELESTKEKYKYDIYAYALMNDHIHLIVYDANENMSIAIQSLNVRYSIYYNKKYERIGHLFENRFKSKVVENENYLKNLVRYIHKNPGNAGLKPYIWTSYRDYLKCGNFINRNIVLKLFDTDREKAIKMFKEFHENYTKNQDYNKDFELLTRIKDEEATQIVKNILNEQNPLKIQTYNKIEKYNAIKKLIQIEGITKEQLSRIIGISSKTISRMVINSEK